MFYQSQVTDDPFEAHPCFNKRQIDIKGDRFDLWQQIRLPLAAKAAGATVLHCPANTAPRAPLVPTLVTIHDLIPLERGAGRHGRQWGRRVGRSARVARRILVPSHHTKQALIAQLGIPESKITVNPWGPNQGTHRVTDLRELNRVRGKYGLAPGQAYVFGFGASDPRKNTVRLMEAWAKVSPGLRERVPLLLVGIEEPALTAFREYARTHCPDGSCRVFGFADERDLPALMSGGLALCYPSLSEGFGLPILDAFACGLAVIASTTTSLPEVAGDAALLVNPENTCALTDALEQVLSRHDLRDQLRARGQERVKAFSWERCARTVARMLGEASGASTCA
jgi:glycosyltransferase involved in cell wall biosynthesis